MDTTSIELVDSEIEAIKVEGNTIQIHFNRAYIEKTMSDSTDITRWWQAGDLIFQGAELTADLPTMPAVCAGGDVSENVYTYRDMIPLPLKSEGHAACQLKIKDSDALICIQAESVEMKMIDRPQYIKHIRKAS